MYSDFAKPYPSVAQALSNDVELALTFTVCLVVNEVAVLDVAQIAPY